jgi:hypothetical protein
MELEPRYVNVVIRRWQAFTGKTACLQGDGRSFDVIAAERTSAWQRADPTSVLPEANDQEHRLGDAHAPTKS